MTVTGLPSGPVTGVPSLRVATSCPMRLASAVKLNESFGLPSRLIRGSPFLKPLAGGLWFAMSVK